MDAFSMFAADHVVVSDPALFFSNLSVVWGYSTLLSVAEEQGQRLQIHPNPTSGPVNVRGFAGRPNRLEVLDIAGRQVASLVFTDRTETDLQLAPGVYTYRIMDLSRVATSMAQGHLVIAR